MWISFVVMLLIGEGSPAAETHALWRAQSATAGASADGQGTATVKGRVLSSVTGKPLRRAQIRIVATELPQSRTTSTDIDGEYELTEIPAGRYTVTVTRSGYIQQQYGQRRPDEPGKPLEIADGQKLEKLDFSLQRAGVITGRVTDETGDTVAGATVWAMQPQFFQGRRRLVPISPAARADDVGQFRLLGLPPGDYVVMATLRETWVVDAPEKHTMGYAPSYFPGTASAAEAQRVKVGLSQQVGPIEFGLVPIRTATVSGTAVGSDGLPLAGATVMLSQEIVGPAGGMMSMAGSARVAPDGTWTLRDVPAGEYQAQVASVDRERPGETVSITLQVQGADLDGVALIADGGGTLAGQVVTDDGSPLPEGGSPIRVFAQRIVSGMGGRSASRGENNGVVGADGRFTLEGVPGGSLIRLLSLATGWALKSIEISGRDYVDVPPEIRGGQRLSGARIVISNRLPSVSGRITDDKDAAVDATVLLFAADASKWLDGSGASRTSRPGQSGLYRFNAVRPGDYLLIAVEYVQPWQVNDPEFLESVREGATRVTVGDAGSKVVDLKMKRGG